MRKVFRARQTLIGSELVPADVEVDTDTGLITAVRTGAELAAALDRDAHLDAGHAATGALVINVPAEVLLLPANVDCHVHVNEPGRTAWEGFASATEAAAYGGIATIVDMPLNSIPPTVDSDALAVKRAVAADKIFVDVGLWGGAVPSNRGRLEELWEQGVYGFKCFLVDSGVPEFPPLEGAAFGAAMAEVAGFGGLMIVHAEDPGVLGSIPPWSSRRYADFVDSRPPEAEVRAVETVIEQVRRHGTRAHILHVSSALALEPIAAARAEGLPVTAETCPHYLIFDSENVPDGAAEFKCCPPIRDPGNQRELWQGLQAGVLDCVVSDHSPSTVEEKTKGGGDLAQAWGGVSSLQVTFGSMVDAAAERGIGVAQVSEWMSAGPARVAGLTGKGRIEVGAAADLIWYEPGRRIAIDGSRLAHRNKLTAYTGRVLSGSVSRTVIAGHTVFDGFDLAEPSGRLLSRAG
ncbi:MAG: allantoinase AllB [Micropruina sp.]|uniref:allantoinase AllB n=1 Tax=Micropruina sp. TaxID=2737536 RepID=UPI0039E4E0E0